MKGTRSETRAREEKSVTNALFRARDAKTGIIQVTVRVPMERIPDLRAVALQWRQEAKMLMHTDYPSADQILQIHSVCRVLDLPLPAGAFTTQATAEEWLLANHPRLGQLHARPPRARRGSRQ